MTKFDLRGTKASEPSIPVFPIRNSESLPNTVMVKIISRIQSCGAYSETFKAIVNKTTLHQQSVSRPPRRRFPANQFVSGPFMYQRCPLIFGAHSVHIKLGARDIQV